MNIVENKKVSPKSYINKHVYERSIKYKKKKKRKVKDDDFIIPCYKDYNNLLEINYNVQQLKKICKKYKLKVSGNKSEKIHRIYNYLKYSNYSIKIQKRYRGHLLRRYINCKGIRYKKNKITNPTDFLTFEKTDDINFDQFFCYKDVDNFVYGFDVRSIYNMLLLNKSAKNPYNRKKLEMDTISNVIEMIKLGKILKRGMNVNIKDDIKELSLQKRLDLKTLSIFQKMDELGFITDPKWFSTLSKLRLIRYIRELIDVWSYRLKIPIETKKNIIPPHGNPFIDIHINKLSSYSLDKLKKISLKVIDNLVSSGVDKDSKYLGTHYVLGSLTLVSYPAACALPWMYESFRYNN
tara:strand:- start:716 stop:1768 length:1053 start_codon:yes stop_codon:yes gene_type:complete